MPLFWGHGGADPTVVTACQAAGVKALTEAGMAVQAETYAGLGHGERARSARVVVLCVCVCVCVCVSAG